MTLQLLYMPLQLQLQYVVKFTMLLIIACHWMSIQLLHISLHHHLIFPYNYHTSLQLWHVNKVTAYVIIVIMSLQSSHTSCQYSCHMSLLLLHVITDIAHVITVILYVSKPTSCHYSYCTSLHVSHDITVIAYHYRYGVKVIAHVITVILYVIKPTECHYSYCMSLQICQ